VTIGDTISGVFTALAFICAMFAVALQSKELSLQREELKQTREELEGQKKEFQIQIKL
jgi:DMSO/TMAO reductase YedYZ heme-binding membrane subunit